MMKTYTYGKTPLQVIATALPFKYSMELNKPDMIQLLQVLKRSSNEWAMEMRTNILETIGIEEM